MRRFVFTLLAVFLFSAGIFAQPGPPAFPGGDSPRPVSPDPSAGLSAPAPDLPAGPFPFMLIPETISAGEILWRPDWPVEMPPDIFVVSGPARSVTITLEFPGAAGRAGSDPSVPPEPADSPSPAGLPGAAARAEYTLAYDGAGRLTDFPFFANGGFFQTRVGYDDLGRIAGLAISAPTSWQIEFLEYDGETGRPSLLRLNAGNAAGNTDAAGNADAAGSGGSGGSWFFVVLEYRGPAASETWYDPAGTGLAFYRYSYTPENGRRRAAEYADLLAGESRAEECYYDSWGNLTGIGGAYSAVYRDSRPQYWRRPLRLPLSGEGAAGEIPWRFIFQWDEQGFVTRILGYPETEAAETGASGAEWDSRYDYSPDANGNWEERREIRMIRRGGYLLPQDGVSITRRIEYQER
ncbi:MAG: hypothetical protein LBI91_00700 [Spirochaetaceae bacterium]|jgi:hypothetical protein|nr:hypothetical protein [Spirochaetaceae bacterium]